jgi:hypothetical protein
MWTAKTRRFLLREDGVTALAVLLALAGVLCLAAVTAGVQFNRFLKQLIGMGRPELDSLPDADFATDSSGLGSPQVDPNSER